MSERTAASSRAVVSAVDSEHAIVGSAVLWPDAVFPNLNGLTSAQFSDPLAGTAFDVARRMWRDAGVVDLVLVVQELGKIDARWDAKQIAPWQSHAARSPAIVQRHEAAIIDAFQRKRIVEQASALSSAAAAGLDMSHEYASLTALADGAVAHAANPALERFRQRLVSRDSLAGIPRPGYLVSGWVPEQALAMLYGPSGAGKTFVAVSMAASVAAGVPWMDCSTSQTRVLYVATEGVPAFDARLKAWEEHRGVEVPDEMLTVHRGAVNLLDDKTADVLSNICRSEEYGLLIIDTLAKCTVGADENSGRDMGPAIACVDQVREVSNTTGLFVHHSGKDGAKGSRGWSGVKGAMDTELEMASAYDLKVTKQKDDRDGFGINLRRLKYGDSLTVDSAETATGTVSVVVAKGAMDVLREIALEGGVPLSSWRDAAIDAGIPKSTFMRYRKTLVTQGFVHNVGTEKAPRYAVPDLTPTQESLINGEATEGDDEVEPF